VGSFGTWVTHLPGRLAHLVQQYAWPVGPVVVLVLLAGVLTWHVARVVAVRRAAAGGWQARVIPPRALDPAQAGQVWDLLAGLARRAAGRWPAAAPPIAFEIHAGQGELAAGLWLPARVPVAVVADIAGQAWPGARVEPGPLPGPAAAGRVVAGYRLAAEAGEGCWLARADLLAPARRGSAEAAEPLRSVLAALAAAPGPAVAQVLVRPAPRRRLKALRQAARHGGTPPPAAGVRAVRAVLNLAQRVPAGPPAAGGRGDPVTAAAVREAAEKTAARPELLATIRVGAAGPRRAMAAGAARQIADGYVLATRNLIPVRLRRPAVLLTQRRARRRDWLVMTAAELGVLAHLPADPARYQFTTAALHRPHPHTAYLARPEPATRRGSGWTPGGWTSTPADPSQPDDTEPRGGDDHDGEH
jgi:hypothetical protein